MHRRNEIVRQIHIPHVGNCTMHHCRDRIHYSFVDTIVRGDSIFHCQIAYLFLLDRSQSKVVYRSSVEFQTVSHVHPPLIIRRRKRPEWRLLRIHRVCRVHSSDPDHSFIFTFNNRMNIILQKQEEIYLKYGIDIIQFWITRRIP